jgi:Domain of unknown function (DUF5666)
VSSAQYRERRQPIQLEDLKPGDHIMIFGAAGDNNQFTARMIARVTQEQMERFANAGDRVFGQITSINNNELKVSNPRTGDQAIQLTDQTQFMKQGQSLTLKDLKVGDRIFAMGKKTDGRFVADRIMVGPMRRRGGGGRFGQPPGSEPPQPPPQ